MLRGIEGTTSPRRICEMCLKEAGNLSRSGTINQALSYRTRLPVARIVAAGFFILTGNSMLNPIHKVVEIRKTASAKQICQNVIPESGNLGT